MTDYHKSWRIVGYKGLAASIEYFCMGNEDVVDLTGRRSVLLR